LGGLYKNLFFSHLLNLDIDNYWYGEIGVKIFTGKESDTFFGQFKDNSNVYAGVRVGF
jgi:hypothetical protein